jgi:hypothetical protein
MHKSATHAVRVLLCILLCMLQEYRLHTCEVLHAWHTRKKGSGNNRHPVELRIQHTSFAATHSAAWKSFPATRPCPLSPCTLPQPHSATSHDICNGRRSLAQPTIEQQASPDHTSIEQWYATHETKQCFPSTQPAFPTRLSTSTADAVIRCATGAAASTARNFCAEMTQSCMRTGGVSTHCVCSKLQPHEQQAWQGVRNSWH